MSRDGYFLIRAASPRAVESLLKNTGARWTIIDAGSKKAPATVVLDLLDYFPDDAAELELYRQRLLQYIPLAKLAKLHTDKRGMFVFDPLVAEQQEASTYDAIIEACEHDGGLWFDPARAATEQTLAFDEREVTVLTKKMIAELVGKKKATKRPASTKKPAPKKRPATHKPTAKKKPAAKKKK